MFESDQLGCRQLEDYVLALQYTEESGMPMLYGIAVTVYFWLKVTDNLLAELEAQGEARASYDYQHRPPTG